MNPLRAYLIVRSISKSYEITVHRDLESLIDAWTFQRTDNDTSALIHVGFWRPDVEKIDLLLSKFQGIVLITASARYSFQTPPIIAPIAAGEINGMPVFAALSGWGYEIDAHYLNLQQPEPLHNSESEAINSEWVLTLSSDLASVSQSAGIIDEISFINLESNLPSEIRLKLAISRYKYFCGTWPSVTNILENLKYAPPWLLNTSIQTLNLSTRASRIFKENAITSVSDLAEYNSVEILRLPKFGRLTFENITEELIKAFQAGPLTKSDNSKLQNLDTSAIRSQPPSSLFEVFTAIFSLLKESEASILRSRMGLSGSSKTLQEIANEIVPPVTRERVRQIESKGIQRIKSLPYWEGLIENRLSEILSNREDSLPIAGLEILDPWFNKIEKLKHPFKYLLEKLCNDKFYVITHNNQYYVTSIDQEAWEECIRRGKQLLAIASEKSTTELESKAMISTLLHNNGKELFAELWLEVSANAHFAKDADGNNVLVSYGYGAEHLVEAILTDADQPLHYSEISRIVNNKNSRQLDIRRAHNAASEIGLLFGRGTYGLQKHFPLSEVETKVLVAEVEYLIENGNPEKQWHCSGIFDEIEKLGLDFGEVLTPYIINIALQQSEKLSSLNRMIWISKSTNLRGASNRIDVHQAIVSILRKEGRVMTSEEIRNKILQDRGLNYYFQIQPEAPLVRVGPGTWGLIDRDLPFKQSRLEGLIEEMEIILRNHQKGIHVTEIYLFTKQNSDIISQSTNTSFLAGIFQKSPIIAADKSLYLYLREWGGSRRIDIKTAIQQALMGNTAMSMNELYNILPKFLGRSIDKVQIGYGLRNLDARYNIEKNTWSLLNESELDNTEIEI